MKGYGRRVSFLLLAMVFEWPRAGAARAEPLVPGEAPVGRVYRVSGIEKRFLYYVKSHLILSAGCLKGGALRCRAYSAAARATLRGLELPPGGPDPGAVACERQLGGRVRWGSSSRGAEVAFCLFGDGSIVTTGSLDYHAHRNAGRRR